MIKLSAAALTCARQPGYSALLFTDVKTPAEHATARMTAAEDLTQMGLTVRSEHIFFGTPSGRQSERITMAVVAQPNEGADRWLRSVLSGRPLDGSAMMLSHPFTSDLGIILVTSPEFSRKIAQQKRHCRAKPMHTTHRGIVWPASKAWQGIAI